MASSDVRFTLGEARANLLARPALTVAMVVTFAASLAAPALLEMTFVVDNIRYHNNLTSIGYSTLSIDAKPEVGATLDSTDCERQHARPAVIAAVWTRDPQPRRAWNVNGPELSTTPIGGDVTTWLRHVPQPAAGAGATPIDARAVIIDDDSLLAAPNPTNGRGTITIVTPTATASSDVVIADLASFGQGYQTNVMIIDPQPGPISRCLLLTELATHSTTLTAYRTAYPGVDGYTVRWNLANADQFQNPIDRYLERPSRHAWILASMLPTLVWQLIQFIRRADRAWYRIIGLSTIRNLALITTELILTISVSAFIATTLLIAQTHAADYPTTISTIGADTFLRTIVATAGMTLATNLYLALRSSRTAIDVLKDR